MGAQLLTHDENSKLQGIFDHSSTKQNKTERLVNKSNPHKHLNQSSETLSDFCLQIWGDVQVYYVSLSTHLMTTFVHD